MAPVSIKAWKGWPRGLPGICYALWAGLACAQAQDARTGVERKVSEIARTSTPPTLDGRLDDAVWAQATIIEDLHQYDPVENGEPTETSRFYVLYDDDNLYVGARLMDSNPAEIDARQLIQDQSVEVDDRIEVVIDPFNNLRTGYRFQINPNGIRRDGIYEGPTEINEEWDGIWAAEASIDEQGWTGEIAIPFKTLNFDPDNPDWGFTVGRVIPRRNEKIAWTSYDREINPAAAGVLTGFSGLQQGKGLDIVPSVNVGSRRNHMTAAESSHADPSLDLFYNVTPSLTGVLTLNTDFSDTEVDDRQVNLTRFPTFFPEKRDFFLQDADIFSFGLKGNDNNNRNGIPFFSRRIGLSDAGRPVDLDVGAKLTGRAGRFNIGALGVTQAGYRGRNGYVEEDELFVGRLAANVLEESSLGMIVTQGDPRSNLDNTLMGGDFRYRNTRLPGGRALEGAVWYQQSNTEGVDTDQSAWGFRASLPSSEGVNASMDHEVFQANFNPALGFVNRGNIGRTRIWGGYRHRPDGHDWIRYVQVFLSWQEFWNASTGELETRNVWVRPFRLENHRGDRFGFLLRGTREVLTEPFEISDGIVIPPGDYDFDAYRLELELAGERTLAPRAEINKGDFYNGTWLQVDAAVDWRPSSRWYFSTGYQYTAVDLPAGSFTTRLIQFRANLAFNAKWSWVNLIQYDNVLDTAGINGRLRWNPRAGEDLYIVLNHESETMAAFSGFRARASEVTVKYSRTFRF